MQLDKKDLNQLAKEINIILSDDDINILLDSMSDIFDKINNLSNLKIASTIKKFKPLNMIFEDKFNTFLREDDNFQNLEVTEVLKNAKQVENNFFYVKIKGR